MDMVLAYMGRFLSSGVELSAYKVGVVRRGHLASHDKNRQKRITPLDGADLSHRFDFEVAREPLGSDLFLDSCAGPLLIDCERCV